MMMKPWQALLNKARSKGGKGRTKRKDPSPSRKRKTRRWVTNGQRNKLCSSVPRSPTKQIRGGNESETWKHSKARRALTCNDSASQNRSSSLRSLQSYRHSEPIESMQNYQSRATGALCWPCHASTHAMCNSCWRWKNLIRLEQTQLLDQNSFLIN